MKMLAGGADMSPIGMCMITALRGAVPGAPVHSSPIAKRWHASENDVGAARRELQWAGGCPGVGLFVFVRRIT